MRTDPAWHGVFLADLRRLDIQNTSLRLSQARLGGTRFKLHYPQSCGVCCGNRARGVDFKIGAQAHMKSFSFFLKEIAVFKI